jgi:beta-1,4-mannosyltransferase
MAGSAAGRRKRAAVVVLGDIGRSPRMQYHSLSLANQAGMEVDIVANGGSDPHLSLRENPSIHIHEMKTVKLTGISKISGALALLLKAAIQFIMLVWFLCFKIPRPDVLLVQVIFEFLSMCIQNFMNCSVTTSLDITSILHAK